MTKWEWQLLEERLPVDEVIVVGVPCKTGSRVRLHPRKGGDIMDVALAGKVGIVESIEQDYEGKIQVAVVLEDDPGRDLGLLKQPGHRFFFSVEELQAL